jgi:hydroxyethylthiazole kinase-like uncharacterized protein yjeF
MEEIYFNFFKQLKAVEPYDLIRKESLPADFFLPRYEFAHKGDFGHALIVAGSYGKAGACILASKACMRAGCGLLTVHIPGRIYDIIQSSFPEAMADVDADDFCFSSAINNLDRYTCIAVGPGIGTSEKTEAALVSLLKTNSQLSNPRPMVIDADALNILSGIPHFEKMLSPKTILTPHAKEFERLFGKFDDYCSQVKFMQQFSKKTGIVVVLKGGVTAVSTPGGEMFFSMKGNPGMATAGSGDVLTGIICGIMAQKCNTEWYGENDYPEAAKLGVFVHATAGDYARNAVGQSSLIASDIIDNIHNAIEKLAVC